MAKSFSCSAITSFLLAITLTCATTQVGAATEGPIPIVTVRVISPLGLTTFRADRLNRYVFSASWEIQVGGPSIDADLYFGMLSPDLKTAYTWVRQDGRHVLVKGMHPIMEGISLNTPATYLSSEMAGGDLRYTVTATEQLGMYLVFALVVVAGRNPADHSNWSQIEMRPLFVQ